MHVMSKFYEEKDRCAPEPRESGLARECVGESAGTRIADAVVIEAAFSLRPWGKYI